MNQYSKGETKEGLDIYCNCNDCIKYQNKICTFFKSKVLNETAGCHHAIIRNWLKPKVSIFDGAKFDDKFKTRDGRNAIYIGKGDKMHILIIEGQDETDFFFDNGGFDLGGKEHSWDIIEKVV